MIGPGDRRGAARSATSRSRVQRLARGEARAATPTQRIPPIEVAFPDLARWSAGNAGIPFVWRFASDVPGPRVTLQALTHGNEVCGAIALDWLLRGGFRPRRGTLTIVFANVAAYESFDDHDPFAARCLDEDFNRLWDPNVLDSARRTRELERARELRACYDETDFLLDLHSMTDPCPALALSGRQRKGLELARDIGIPAYVVIDEGHRAGRRLRDYAHFDDPDDPRSALLVECGQHWEAAAPAVAQQVCLRFLRHFGMADAAFVDSHLEPGRLPPQHAIEITDVVTIENEDFSFALPLQGLMTIPAAQTLIARDGDRAIVSPYADCVLVMPSRRPRVGETAVRIGRFVD
ncbi:MAG TPA: succinylglutamate desuccinylase/aspartoacylase family protein [Casimicrobiaceae bacterium]